MNKIEYDLDKITFEYYDTINNILKYICNINKLEYNQDNINKYIYNNTKYYITNLFRNIRNIKYREVDLRNERAKLKDDLEILKRAYVSGDNLNINETGKNTGGKENQVELRQIKMLQLKEEINQKLLESLLLEKSLSDRTTLFKDFTDLIPNEQHRVIIQRIYLNCETSTQIADDYMYSNGTVSQYRNRGINFLIKLIKYFIEHIVY